LTNFNKGLYGNQSYCIGDTSPVTDYEQGASPYGALNMAGNVWEWVNDWYGSNYYSNSSTRNPAGPTSGRYRVIRGGSGYLNGRYIRAAYRSYLDPTSSSYINGFRCVLPQP
jgi:formylglycine-generating enzyme required for sulfatase activity